MFRHFINSVYSFISNNTTFKVILTHPDSRVPKKADVGSAGYDVFSTETYVLQPGQRELISIGIITEIPRDFYLRVAPRSSLAINGIDIGAGVIDSSYRGEIMVLVINNSKQAFQVQKGMRIAQLILERCLNAPIDLVDRLSETERGYGGFGSTGK